MFIDAFSNSGGSIPSVDIEARIDSPGSRSSNDDAADRRMIFSAAYRSMVKVCDEEATKLFMRMCGDPFISKTVGGPNLEVLAKEIRRNLECLSKFYGVTVRTDPRAILRRQVKTG
jgi:hypothetical protein